MKQTARTLRPFHTPCGTSERNDNQLIALRGTENAPSVYAPRDVATSRFRVHGDLVTFREKDPETWSDMSNVQGDPIAIANLAWPRVAKF